MITCAKGGQQRSDVVKMCGAGEFLSRYNWLKCYLAKIPCTKTCVRTESGLPALLPLSAMYTMKFWLRLKQLQSWSQNEVALAILKKDRYMF